MENREFEWELSKENVQPLKQGRSIASLSAGLQHHPDWESKLKEERHAFELELRTYDGEDPMALWDTYIKWTEQHYPKGGKDSHLSELLQRCVQQFNNDDKYKNDPRFLDVWMKLIRFSASRVEMFDFMYNHGIGSGLASFYELWACELEELSNLKRANKIYMLGIEKGAKPVDYLQRKLGEFQARVAHRMASGDLGGLDQGEMDTDAAERDRLALGELKGRGKKQVVPSVRAGAAKPSRGVLKMANPVPSSNNNAGQGFAIFSDENASSGHVAPPQTADWAAVPTKQKVNRENEQKASKWTNQKMKQRGMGSVPLSGASASRSQVSFSVHADEDAAQPMMTPRKVNPEVNSALSEKKAKPKDPFESLQVKQQQNEMPMYNKFQVYGGVEEFSFEEIHAARWFAIKKKEREMQEREAAVAAALEEQLQKKLAQDLEAKMKLVLNEQQAQLQAQLMTKAQSEQSEIKRKEELAAKEEMIRQRLASEYEAKQRQAQADLERLQREKEEKEAQMAAMEDQLRQKIMAEMEAKQASLSELSSQMSGQHASYQLSMKTREASNSMITPGREEILSVNNPTPSATVTSSTFSSTASSGGHIPPVPEPSPESSFACSTNSGSLGHGVTPVMSSGGPYSNEPTPNNSSVINPFSRSFGRSNSIAAPSPTVHSKQAMAAVMGFFNGSVDICQDLGWDKPNKDETMDLQFSGGASSKAAPFQIFCDAPSQPSKPKENPLFPTSENDENRPLSAFQKPLSRKPVEDIQMSEPAHPSRMPGGDTFKKPAPFPIFSDENVAVKKQEQPPEDVVMKSAKKDGRMLGEETFSTEPVGGIWDDQQMEGIEAFPEDMTFAPYSSSTRVFKLAANLISTPFNAEMAELSTLPAPPLSVIKPGVLQAAADTGSSDDKPVCASNIFADEIFSSESAGASKNQPQPGLGRKSVGASRKSLAADLSTIIESHEDSSKSSNASKSTTHSSGAASVHHTANSTHGLGLTSHNSTNHHMSNNVSEHHSNVGVSMAAREAVEILSPVEEEAPSKVRLYDEGGGNATCHEIDLTNWEPADLDKTSNLLSQSIMIDPTNPFDEKLIARFIRNLPHQLVDYPNYVKVDADLPAIHKSSSLMAGGMNYVVCGLIGEGAYAKVFRIKPSGHDIDMDMDESEEKVIKVQRPACPWEFYIITEVHKRLQATQMGVRMCPAIMHVDYGFFFNDGSILVNSYHEITLLSFVNLYKMKKERVPESYTVFITIELLRLARALQQSDIIHGDIKPDNFLFKSLPKLPNSDAELRAMLQDGDACAVKLIDWGRSIDMSLFPEGTTFTTKVSTSGFQCIEMMTDQPWTYQTDLFNIVGTIHVLLFGEYMKVCKIADHWTILKNTRRFYQLGALWKEFFDEFLNIPDCDSLPDLSVWIEKFVDAFISNDSLKYQHNEKLVRQQLMLFSHNS